ncbi:MAG: response regulator [Hyphomonadaceae bacterium]|nr:response regulator [Hyphomonadaceae bacterium]
MIHIIDDDEAMRESLQFLLASAQLDSRTYESATALLARVDELEPGCIVTDVRMPGMDGLDLVRRLNALAVPHPVIVLTGHADVPLAVEAMKLGVLEFLEKPFTDDALLQAVNAALSLSGAAAVRGAEREELLARRALLTARERDVFDAIVAGDSNKVAAQRLGISPRTVEIYRANVMAKMHAGSLSELVRMALRCEEKP